MQLRRKLALPVAVSAAAVVAAGLAPGVAAAGKASPRGHAAAAAASSYGFVGITHGDFDALVGLSKGSPQVAGPVSVVSDGDNSATTAITPDGSVALLGNDGQNLTQEGLTHHAPSKRLDLAEYGGEGGPSYGGYSEGISIGAGFALDALDEQGVLQLRPDSAGLWKPDKRVQFPGQNEAGDPHQPGFIRFPASSGNDLTEYDGSAVSTVPLKNGHYAGLVIDRGGSNGALAVLDGVGTAHPTVAKLLEGTQFGEIGAEDLGTGAMAFSPVTATRAVVATPTGLTVVDLTKPAHPTLHDLTLGAPGAVESVAVAPDGNHVALGVDNKIFGYTGLHRSSGKLTRVSTTTLGTAGNGFHVYSAAFLRNSKLVVEYTDQNAITLETLHKVAVYSGATGAHPSLAGSTELSDGANVENSLSVYPAATAPTIAVSPRHARVGKHAKLVVKVSGGVGAYHAKVVAGHLPKGLHLRHNRIVGTPKHAGTHTVLLRATNQYGGAVFGVAKVKVAKQHH